MAAHTVRIYQRYTFLHTVVITRSNITNITPWLEQEIIVESKKRISPVRYRLPENHEASLLDPGEMDKNQPNLYKSP